MIFLKNFKIQILFSQLILITLVSNFAQNEKFITISINHNFNIQHSINLTSFINKNKNKITEDVLIEPLNKKLNYCGYQISRVDYSLYNLNARLKFDHDGEICEKINLVETLKSLIKQMNSFKTFVSRTSLLPDASTIHCFDTVHQKNKVHVYNFNNLNNEHTSTLAHLINYEIRGKVVSSLDELCKIQNYQNIDGVFWNNDNIYSTRSLSLIFKHLGNSQLLNPPITLENVNFIKVINIPSVSVVKAILNIISIFLLVIFCTFWCVNTENKRDR